MLDGSKSSLTGVDLNEPRKYIAYSCGRNFYSIVFLYTQLSLLRTPGGFDIYSNYIKFELYKFLQKVF